MGLDNTTHWDGMWLLVRNRKKGHTLLGRSGLSSVEYVESTSLGQRQKFNVEVTRAGAGRLIQPEVVANNNVDESRSAVLWKLRHKYGL